LNHEGSVTTEKWMSRRFPPYFVKMERSGWNTLGYVKDDPTEIICTTPAFMPGLHVIKQI